MSIVQPPTDLEARLVRCNRFDAISRIADDISHEIKNPLHAMVINLELVKRRVVTGDGEAALERAAIVEEEIQRVHHLVDALLRLLRPAPEVDGVDVEATLDDMLPVLEAEARVQRVEFRYVPAGRPTPLHVDPAHLRHAVLNLFLNAVEVLGQGGGRVELAVEAGDKDVRVRVADSGPGLPASLAGRLGEVGCTTHPGREGLGVAVAAWVAAASGGRLYHESGAEAGIGTTFTLLFPRQATT